MGALTKHLVIFAKEPRLGRVKTRLGREIGLVHAWAFYRGCLTDTARRMAADKRWRTWLAVTPDNASSIPYLPSGISVMPQGGGDLGVRMGNAMGGLPPGPVVIIGTDIPGITCTHVAEAFRMLGRADAVFGPANDGGYWLVGCRRRPRFPDMFNGVRWSTNHALSDTVENLRQGGFKTRMLNTLEDVDDAASYRRWRDRT